MGEVCLLLTCFAKHIRENATPSHPCTEVSMQFKTALLHGRKWEAANVVAEASKQEKQWETEFISAGESF